MRAILLAMAALYLLFASRYTVPDRYAFFIPFYVLVAVLIGVGVKVVQEQTRFARGGPVFLALALLPIASISAHRPRPERNSFPWALGGIFLTGTTTAISDNPGKPGTAGRHSSLPRYWNKWRPMP